MRVALVTYGLNVGGMENFLFTLADSLRAHGIQVSFVVTEMIGAWHQRAIDEGFEIVNLLPKRWRSLRGQAQRLARVLGTYDAALFNHCRLGQAIAADVPSSCRIVPIFHNDDDVIYRVGLANVSQVDSVVCVGSKVFREALRRGAPADRTIQIPYGINVPASWPKEGHSRNGRPLRIVFLGRLNHKQKGVLDVPAILCRAAELGVALRLDLVGEDDVDAPFLREELTKKLPASAVRFHGRTDHATALRLLSEADILLMPSRYEGLPIALLEALAQGAVPVASHLPGITDDVVADGVTGILSPVGDIEGFARAIARLQDDEERLRMSHAAWQSARDRYGKEAMVARYLELLNSPREVRARNTESPDLVGRMFFGKRWDYPIGVVDIAVAVRRTLRSGRNVDDRTHGSVSEVNDQLVAGR
jgi:glycosyltransferase involved in cell wall biosynthesis